MCSGAAVDVEVGAVTEGECTAAAAAFPLWEGEGALCAVCALPSSTVFNAGFSDSASLGDCDGDDDGLSLPALWTGDD